MHDHRKLGRDLEIFDTDPLIGAGLPYWLPAGAAIRHALEEYVRELERKAGDQHVYSPVLAKRELYEISGHWAHYRDGMYPPMEIGGEQVVLRPSLCPHHALIYRSRGRSYRELPLRMAELRGMHRSELSGVLGGLTRVRSIQLNDAHIFCAPDQVAAILTDVLVGSGIDFDAEQGEAAFYGPKIDVQVADSAERETTLSTIQVDFYQPERFGLRYIGPDGGKHRPVMVHHSVIGSAERAVAHLIDVPGGAFPGGLAPVQLAVLPITEAELPQAEAFARQAVEQRIRANIAGSEHGSLGARIRAGRLVPYQAIIGASEAAAGQVALRLRDGRKLAALAGGEVLDRIADLVNAYSTELWSISTDP